MIRSFGPRSLRLFVASPAARPGAARLLLLPLALAAVACGYDNERYVEPELEIAEAPIDEDGLFEPVAPGQGTGLFIEYTASGRWHLFTSCDTALLGSTRTACAWDIQLVVAEGSRVRSFETENFESDDWIFWEQGTFGEFVVYTGNDLDGVFFDADAGQALRIDAYLDGRDARGYINWIAGGAVVRGAPTNPVDLYPEAPAVP